MTNKKTEICVNCGGATQYAPNEHVDIRIGYVDGAGQMCRSCWTKFAGDKAQVALESPTKSS